MPTLTAPNAVLPRSTDAADGAPSFPSWRESVDPYAKSHLGRSLWSLATSVVPFVALWIAMYFSLQISYVLTLALAIPAAGFLVRVYILFHDCTHGSFLKTRKANDRLGAVLGLLVFTPFAKWRYEHAVHHATAGDLDRRGVGDVPTMTLAEYKAWPWYGRLGYRLFRNPVVMFGLGPIFAMLIEPRIPRPSAAKRIRHSVWLTNLSLVLVIGGLCLLIGWQSFLLVEVPFVFLAGGSGIWLFYVQHQFDSVYWKRTPEWSYEDAALLGSSYLKLPKILQFFSGNIGLHHAHHLSAKIPNYNLQRAHDGIPLLRNVPKLSFAEALRTVRFKLWDEDAARLVTWSDLRRGRALAGRTAT